MYAVVECSCHVSLAISIFLTVGLSVERFQASSIFLIILYYFILFYTNKKNISVQAVCRPLVYRSRTSGEGLPCVLTYYVRYIPIPIDLLCELANCPLIKPVSKVANKISTRWSPLSSWPLHSMFHVSLK